MGLTDGFRSTNALLAERDGLRNTGVWLGDTEGGNARIKEITQRLEGRGVASTVSADEHQPDSFGQRIQSVVADKWRQISGNQSSLDDPDFDAKMHRMRQDGTAFDVEFDEHGNG